MNELEWIRFTWLPQSVSPVKWQMSAPACARDEQKLTQRTFVKLTTDRRYLRSRRILIRR